ncbi:phage tail protein [Listeria costaricensis]|uniref:phage tail protein n=1 Tax=Listeria costaricensis TaxID=2026604 RepID=UPI000C079263|nr:phage tail protein [Listeria costaricensis]
MDYLIVRSIDGAFEEILTSVNYDSFSYSYERNTSRTISFSIRRTEQNAFSFELLENEATVIYQGQQFVVKKCTPKVVGAVFSKEITAHHISYTIQDHMQYAVQDGEKTYSLQSVLEFALNGNELGFSFQVIGSFGMAKLENLGDKNGLELINLCVDSFGAIFFADNKKLLFYDEANWYRRTEKQLRYLYNTEDVTVDVNTDTLKTYIKCYGKQKDEPDKYSGDNKYTAVVTYMSPNAEKYGKRMAAAKSNDKITTTKELLEFAKGELMDVPDTSLTLTYRGDEPVSERDIWYFIHEPMGFETEVHVTRIKSPHPWSLKPQEIGFSNTRRDMVRLQSQMAKRVTTAVSEAAKSTERIRSISRTAAEAYDSRILTEVVGEVH